MQGSAALAQVRDDDASELIHRRVTWGGMEENERIKGDSQVAVLSGTDAHSELRCGNGRKIGVKGKEWVF